MQKQKQKNPQPKTSHITQKLKQITDVNENMNLYIFQKKKGKKSL